MTTPAETPAPRPRYMDMTPAELVAAYRTLTTDPLYWQLSNTVAYRTGTARQVAAAKRDLRKLDREADFIRTIARKRGIDLLVD